MQTAFTDIEKAVSSLGISDQEFHELAAGESRRILRDLKARYCDGVNTVWWWQHYSNAASWVPDVDGYTLLPVLCPDPRVLLIPHEEDEERIYESTPALISRVLGECSAFEYSVAGIDLDWLLTENHHNVLIAVGEKAKQKLEEEKNA